MREILFRGKGAINGYWVYGDYVNHGTKHYIYTEQEDVGYGWYEVDPKSLGQFTGLTDKNGKQIFEGDIVKFEDADCYPYHEDCFTNAGEVCYCGRGFTITDRVTVEMEDLIDGNTLDCEVIGNIYDNPELLGGAE